MKRIMSIVLIFVLLFSCVPFSAAAIETIPCGTELSGTNVGGHDYFTNWSSNTYSYLIECADKNLMRVVWDTGNFASWDNIEVAYYTPDYQLIKTVYPEMELEIFGGFHAMENGYYLLFGQTNYDERPDVEVMRLVKYDKNWNRIGAISYYGCNTFVPFDAGNVDFAHDGTTMVIRTNHTMYMSGDGKRHTSNMTFAIDTETMETLKAHYHPEMNVGYVSHSFHQLVEFIDGRFVAVDLGDGHPRAVCLNRFTEDAFVPWQGTRMELENIPLLEIPGEVGNNYTGVTVGGFTDSATSYLVAGTSRLENPNVRNIFVSVLPKNGTTATVRYLTDYPSSNASNPHLVKISDQSSLVLWNYGGMLYYQELDAEGKNAGPLRSFKGTLSDCEPIVSNGKVQWFAYNYNDVTFYTIDTADLSKTAATTVNHGHTTEYKNNATHHWYECTKCQEKTYIEKHSASDSTAYNKFTKEGTMESGCGYCGHPFNTEKLTAALTGSGLDATLKVGSKTLVKNTDYQCMVINESTIRDQGAYQYVQATLRFKGKGRYSGIYDLEVYSIPYICSVGLIKKQQYTGKAVKPEMEITHNGKVLKEGVDYTVTYKNNVAIGTATAIIQGKGVYFGSVEQDFSIVNSLAHPFKDVSKKAWYQNSVQYVYDQGLMNGMSETAFAPEETTTRAQLVTVLYRMENEPYCSGDYPFYDVPPQTWCTLPVLWAYKNGIVNGTSEKLFSPMAAVSREQIATILYRFVKNYKGYDASKSVSISKFPDANKVSDYAKEAMKWAVAEGLITGTEKNGKVYLDPQGSATRAQIATILMRFDQKF